MLQFSLFLLGAIAPTVSAEYKLPIWKCDGGVTYYDAPILYYWNEVASTCFGTRKGCTPASVKTKLYENLANCIKDNLPNGKHITKRFMCEDDVSEAKIYKVPFVPGKEGLLMMPRCNPEERVCPQGYVCRTMDATQTSACCSLTEKVPKAEWLFSFIYNQEIDFPK